MDGLGHGLHIIEYLKTVMRYYVADFNVDGYRLDVADRIPLDFWEEARERWTNCAPAS